MPDLLLELFSEEIPARMQARAADDLCRLVTAGLAEAGLPHGAARSMVTPRRLVLAVEGLAPRAPERREERKGPRVDAPEAALQGFLRATGLAAEDLERREDRKGAVWFATLTVPGRAAPEIVADVVAGTLRAFPWPKSMRWGAGSLRWVRPLSSILCLLSDETGAEVVPLEIDGIRAGAVTRGHRFMAPNAFSVTGLDDYTAKLKRAHVLLDPEERAARILNDARALAFARGLELIEDRGLLAEVAGLVEWPVALLGEIGPEFRDLPAEVLQTSMREHQKFFSLRTPGTGRIGHFVTIANVETADAGATILAGNGKVLRARLSDAKFFWENDLRVISNAGLEGMAEGLAAVTFHGRLGSQADRVARIAALAAEIAPMVGADAPEAALAARVAKADLRSEMVGEFPELQGIMGMHYARAQGLSDAVALACREHYQPLGPSDSVPTAPVSVAVALADKLDTLTGFWAIDEKPTGSKDPYALRRAALGVIRLVLGNGVRVGLRMATVIPMMGHLVSLLTEGRGANAREIIDALNSLGFGAAAGQVRKTIEDSAPALGAELTSVAVDQAMERCDDLLSFLHDRLKVHLREQGIRHDVIDACLAMPGNDDLSLLVMRAEALAAFLATDDGENLVQGFRRCNNILVQAEEKDGVSYELDPDPRFADHPAEHALFAALDAADVAIPPALQAEDFA
ncbi:MAG: glycine--tRNA ligase subunit beta, partial [Rhodobacteraceae bacterium]|nr:glycine--tRNA ligase subunit beta [Paracoccaceae bacterium]